MPSTNPCINCQSPVDKTICTKPGKCARLLAYKDGEPDEYIFGEPIPTAEELGVSCGRTDSNDGQPNAGGKMSSTTKICKVDGCDVKARCRGFCLKHYDMWRHNKLPGYPKFVPIQKHKSPSKNKPIKKAPREKTTRQPKAATSPAAFQFNVDLTRYPQMRDLVVATSTRFCVPPEHIIISLMGEGLAARQKNASI